MDPGRDIEKYRSRAEQGDALAQFTLGAAYFHATPPDHAEAARWYRKAAEQGHADAQFSLGVLYHRGLGVAQDYASAARWYLAAATRAMRKARTPLACSMLAARASRGLTWRRCAGFANLPRRATPSLKEIWA